MADVYLPCDDCPEETPCQWEVEFELCFCRCFKTKNSFPQETGNWSLCCFGETITAVIAKTQGMGCPCLEGTYELEWHDEYEVPYSDGVYYPAWVYEGGFSCRPEGKMVLWCTDPLNVGKVFKVYFGCRPSVQRPEAQFAFSQCTPPMGSGTAQIQRRDTGGDSDVFYEVVGDCESGEEIYGCEYDGQTPTKLEVTIMAPTWVE